MRKLVPLLSRNCGSPGPGPAASPSNTAAASVRLGVTLARSRAQWNDDYHHAWHVLLTGETHGYYGDYRQSPLRDIARALASGFVYQGEASAHRDGQLRGEPSGQLAPLAFVNFLQNHDQIGNRALGDRLESIADPNAIEAGLAITLLAPAIPMLFMGEEWGSKAPFPFFCGFEGELADAVRKGRHKEFAGAYEKYGDEVPDPLQLSTFQSAVLDWESRDQAAGKKRLALVRDLLAVRRREIVPRLADAAFGDAQAAESGLLTAHWRMANGATLQLAANLSNSAIAHQRHETTGRPIWGGERGDLLPPWSVFWRLETH
jgi:maltooligosyltrehalose trehalohydrolase